MIELTLCVLLIILISFGLLEKYYHKVALSYLPIRIHINGSRGKSSVTRLVAAGLREGGIKTLGKTTGTAPRIIDECGKDKIIHRLRSASIGEQMSLLRAFAKKKPDAIVIECMAVNPQYQWISEHEMINSTLSVITNIRPDHLDEMGITLEDNAMSLSNTIPYHGRFVTVLPNNSDNSLNQKLLNKLEKISNERDTEYIQASYNDISLDFMEKFSYLEHQDNVALALKVCQLSGVQKEIALRGMLKAQPDPGATLIWKLKCGKKFNFFINLLAANDPSSTLHAYNILSTRIQNSPICIFINTRQDRRYRTNQLLSLVYNVIKPEMLIIRGENLPSTIHKYKKETPNIIFCQLPNNINIDDIMFEFSKIEKYYIIGIGNMVGWGEQFIKDLKRFKYDK